MQDGRDGESQVAAAGGAPVPGRQDGAERGAAAEAGGGERGDSGQGEHGRSPCDVIKAVVSEVFYHTPSRVLAPPSGLFFPPSKHV